MRRVILFSAHYLESIRRCDWHFLADAYWRGGWDVVFFTVGISHISRIRRDHRFQYPIIAEANRLKSVKERLSSFVWFQPWHPINLCNSVLNRLSLPFFARYGKGPLGEEGEHVVRQADLFLFESTPGIMLVERLKRLNPGARFVYRVSDDTRVVGFHPVVTQAEQRFAHLFDLISLTSPKGFEHLHHLPNAAVHYHGVEKQLFDREYQNPYDGKTTNVVSVGGTLFDGEALEIASELFPRWTFHVFGWCPVAQRQNVKQYGEVPFVETVPYIKHADIGLALYSNAPGAEYLAESSLKMLQYTYCRLPIMAPMFATSKERPHVFGYKAGDVESIRLALYHARAYDRTNIDREAISTWDALANSLAGPESSRLRFACS